MVVEKIKKLLALANNEGATPEEASTAMSMASSLMLKYSITEAQLDEKKSSTIDATLVMNDISLWEATLLQAAAVLNSCRCFHTTRTKSAYIVGGLEYRQAATEMLNYLIRSVIASYKSSLPRGLSVSDRADYRKNFKLACAGRINLRAHEIMDRLKSNDEEAKKATGCTALVVVDAIDKQLSDIEDWMVEKGILLQKPKARALRAKISEHSILGRLEGTAHGQQIELQKKMY